MLLRVSKLVSHHHRTSNQFSSIPLTTFLQERKYSIDETERSRCMSSFDHHRSNNNNKDQRSSRWAYVKHYEMLRNDTLMPNVWIVLRVDGKNFSQFTRVNQYEKPMDHRAIHLMNTCALHVMKSFPEVLMSYGQSDEINFLLERDTNLFSRRTSKLNSLFASLVASNFVMHWSDAFSGQKPLQYAPAFDSRCIAFPTLQSMKDYFRWRQDDAFVNHVYNTCFWNLVQKQGKTLTEAQNVLSGTTFSDRNELLFNTFGINIAKDPAIDRRGTILIRSDKVLTSDQSTVPSEESSERQVVDKQHGIIQLHDDFVGEQFWQSQHASRIIKMDQKCT